MKQLTYSVSTGCCGGEINDMMICPECREHSAESYYTPDGDELTEQEAWAVDLIGDFSEYINALPPVPHGREVMIHRNGDEMTTGQIKALVRVCELYDLKHTLLESLGFSLHINIGSSTLVFCSVRLRVASSPKEKLMQTV